MNDRKRSFQLNDHKIPRSFQASQTQTREHMFLLCILYINISSRMLYKLIREGGKNISRCLMSLNKLTFLYEVHYSLAREIERRLRKWTNDQTWMECYQVNRILFCKFPSSLLSQGFGESIPVLQTKKHLLLFIFKITLTVSISVVLIIT